MKNILIALALASVFTGLIFGQTREARPESRREPEVMPKHAAIAGEAAIIDAAFARAEAEKQFPMMQSTRRTLHMYPEVSFKEEQTSKIIREKLDTLGISYQIAGKYGVVATIEGEKPGRTVALRADIDALSIQELTDLEFKSRNEGVMHACGHDVHIAMLLGAANILHQNRSRIKGKVRIIFQQAEEMGAGALMMIKAGALDDVDAIFGIHQAAEYPSGQVRVSEKEVMAANAIFTVKLKGKGGHGAQPQLAVDALVAAASMVQNIQTLVSREMAPMEPVVVSVGTLTSGTRANIIAETAEFKGTIRYFNPNLQYTIEESFKRIVKGIADAYRVTVDIDYLHAGVPVYNDPVLSDLSHKTAVSVVGTENVTELGKLMGSEDFAFYQQKLPGVFIFLGAGNAKKNLPMHNPRYDVVEESMITGAALHVQFALNYLDNSYK